MLTDTSCSRAGRWLLSACLLTGVFVLAPAPARSQDRPFNLDGLRPLKKKIGILDVQARLAVSEDPLLKRTRIDRIYFTFQSDRDRTLNFEGICLDPRCANKGMKDTLLNKTLKDIFVAVISPEDAEFKAIVEKAGSSVDKVEGIDQLALLPERVLQKEVEGNNLDGTLFLGGYYNARRQLVLEGLAGHASQVGKPLEKFVKETTDRILKDIAERIKPEANALWFKSRNEKDGILPDTQRLRDWDWAKTLQEDLVRAREPAELLDLCEQTLVRRVWFNYEGPNSELKCWIDANCLKAGFVPEDRNKLQTVLDARCTAKWTEVSGDYFFKMIREAKPNMPRLPSIEAGLMKYVESPVYTLQNRVNEVAAMEGSLVERAVYDGAGTLRVKAFVNPGTKKDHQTKLMGFLTALVEARPGLLRAAKWLPTTGRAETDVTEYAETLSPQTLQEMLSRAGNPLIFRQTRVDRISFEYPEKKLQFQLRGASLHPDWPKGLQGAPATAKTLFGDPLMTRWLKKPPVHRTTQPEINIDRIEPTKPAEDPVLNFQSQVAAEPKLDGVLFLPATYDGSALLNFPVRIDPVLAGQKQRAEQFVADLWKNTPKHLCFRPGETRAPAIHVTAGAGMQALRWTLQEKLAQSRGHKELRETRLHRVWFDYGGKPARSIKNPELVCKGVFLYWKEEEKAAPPPGPVVKDSLVEMTAELWRLTVNPWDDKVALKANLTQLDPFPHPGPALQVEVAKPRPPASSLDGVRFYRADDREAYSSEFDAKGWLILRGQWRGEQQKKQLDQFLKDFFAVRLENPDGQGLLLDLAEYRTDRVLHDLRLFAADRFEDVLLERLYFDAKGIVKLAGSIPEHKSEEYRPKLTLELESLLEKAGMGGPKRQRVLLASASLVPWLVGQLRPKEKVDLTEVKAVKGLTQYLRETLQAPVNPDAAPPPDRWDGIWFTRGYYDPQGNYFPVGYLGRAPQRDQLDVLIQELAPTQWRPQLPRSWNLERLNLMPLEPMLARMRIVMPAYDQLDRLVLQRAFHDVAGTLVLRINVVGFLPRDARITFKALLDAHPEWKERSAVGVRLQLASRPVPSEPRVVEESLLNGITRLKFMRIESARELASTAILHDPEDSTAWYVRALTFFLEKDIEQAERDLRRTVQLEREGVRFPGARANLRLERLELLQTKHRQMLNEGRKKVLNDVESGKPPIKLSRTP